MAVKGKVPGPRSQVPRSVIVLLALALSACATTARTGALCAELKGAGPGSDALDPQASGSARLEIRDAAIRFHVRTSSDLGKVVATHLHKGTTGVNGPMAIELNPGFSGEVIDGSIPVEPDLATGVLASPSQYYVKLHSLKFPGGAIRGQLHQCGPDERR